KSIINDASHPKARYKKKSPKEILADPSKKRRKSIYEINESMKVKFPSKSATNELRDEIEYCQKLMNVIENEEAISQYPKVNEKPNLLKETVSDDIEHSRISDDEDAKIGYKTKDTSCLGYKTQIAMSEERIITAATVTTGEKNDGKELETLIEKSKEAGMEVNSVIGDAAYAEKGNIEYTNKNEVELVAKLNPITQGTR